MIIEIKTTIDELDKVFGQVWRYTINLSHSQGIDIKNIERKIVVPRSSLEQQISDSLIWSPFRSLDLIRLCNKIAAQTNTCFLVLDKF